MTLRQFIQKLVAHGDLDADVHVRIPEHRLSRQVDHVYFDHPMSQTSRGLNIVVLYSERAQTGALSETEDE